MEEINKKKILVNTLMLYIRMILIMLVSLYTSRIVLENLGVEDFGIYNVVGGIVIMFGFLNSAMSSATQRFLSYEIGKKDTDKLNQVFSISISIHFLISIIVLLLAETIGLWFLNNRMNIPLSRLYAANWVYQCSLLTFIVNIMSVPYNALIIAREKMSAFAYISIIEVILKLISVVLLVYIVGDRLIVYAILLLLISLLIRGFYQFYCRFYFVESRYKFVYNKELMVSILSFSGWSLFGGVAYIAKNQGVNIVLNLFCGPLANAAWSIAQQVNVAILSMISNFSTAINPPIVKSYANNDLKNTLLLLFSGMKYSFFMSICLIMPLFFNCHYIFSIWLKSIPENSIVYTQLLLMILLIESIIHPISATVQATGEIKWYQGIIGLILFCNLPLSYFALQYGYSSISIFYIAMILSVLSVIARLFILYRLFPYPIYKMVRLLIVIVTMILFNLLIYFYLKLESMNFVMFIFNSSLIVLSNIFLFYLIGLDRDERTFLHSKIIAFFKK